MKPLPATFASRRAKAVAPARGGPTSVPIATTGTPASAASIQTPCSANDAFFRSTKENMTLPTRPTLPSLALDYEAGILTNTLTGEYGEAVYGVILAYREDRVLWPTIGELPRLPICVNGSSEFGPCLCAFADWGTDGTPPDCTEELTVLLWMDDGAQVMTLTARRSQVRTLTRYLDMKAMMAGVLHDQYVTIQMTPEGQGHRLTLLPGALVDREAQERLAAVAGRVVASGAFEALG